MEFEYGWISPEGNTHRTRHEGHSESAESLCEEYGYRTYNFELELERRGWIKVTASWESGLLVKIVFCELGHITRKQADKLFELGLQEVDYAKYYIRHSDINDC